MWSNGIGWILSLVPIIFISTIAITKILKGPKEMSIMEVIFSKHLLHVSIVCIRAQIQLTIIQKWGNVKLYLNLSTFLHMGSCFQIQIAFWV